VLNTTEVAGVASSVVVSTLESPLDALVIVARSEVWEEASVIDETLDVSAVAEEGAVVSEEASVTDVTLDAPAVVEEDAVVSSAVEASVLELDDAVEEEDIRADEERLGPNL